MAYQKKYFFSFKDTNEINYRVEIWENSAAIITAVEVRGDDVPFSVDYPETDNKFQPVRGSGCTINLVSENNMQFLDLYTADMFKFQIRAFRGEAFYWCGYLDSEIYSEPFNDLDNYPVSISGTDGFALLDRMLYLQDNGTKFSGMSTQFDILKFIVGKMGLPLDFVFMSLSTTITGVTNLAGETLLNNTYVLNSNFYNEDGEPATLRTVLESILQPYGAFIKQQGGSLYITDNTTILSSAGNLFTFNQYNALSFAFLGVTSTLSTNAGDLSNIGFTSGEQTLSVVSGINKQVVIYSPYSNIDLINFEAETDFSGQGTTSAAIGATGYKWTETPFTASNSWTPYNNGTFQMLNGVDDTTEKDSYLCIKTNGSATGTLMSYNCKVPLPKIIKSGYKLQIKVNGYFRKSNDLNNPTYTPSVVKQGILYVGLRIGNQKYVNNTLGYEGHWVDGASSEQFRLFFNNVPTGTYNNMIYSPIEDNWIEAAGYTFHNGIVIKKDYLIPLDNVEGVIDFSIYEYTAKIDYSTRTTCLDARFKDIIITVLDADGKEVENLDIEYVGYMNSQYKESGEDISLIQGTNLTDNPAERGGLLKCVGGVFSWIKQWTRNGVTDNIENLLLRSYVGNYTGKTLSLTCQTNLINNHIGFITYNKYLTQKFIVVACSHDCAAATSDLTLQEITLDSLTINKSF